MAPTLPFLYATLLIPNDQVVVYRQWAEKQPDIGSQNCNNLPNAEQYHDYMIYLQLLLAALGRVTNYWLAQQADYKRYHQLFLGSLGRVTLPNADQYDDETRCRQHFLAARARSVTLSLDNKRPKDMPDLPVVDKHRKLQRAKLCKHPLHPAHASPNDEASPNGEASLNNKASYRCFKCMVRVHLDYLSALAHVWKEAGGPWATRDGDYGPSLQVPSPNWLPARTAYRRAKVAAINFLCALEKRMEWEEAWEAQHPNVEIREVKEYGVAAAIQTFWEEFKSAESRPPTVDQLEAKAKEKRMPKRKIVTFSADTRDTQHGLVVRAKYDRYEDMSVIRRACNRRRPVRTTEGPNE